MKIAEIARQHDRTYGAIRARLKKQGLINNSCKLYLKQYFFPCSMPSVRKTRDIVTGQDTRSVARNGR